MGSCFSKSSGVQRPPTTNSVNVGGVTYNTPLLVARSAQATHLRRGLQIFRLGLVGNRWRTEIQLVALLERLKIHFSLGVLRRKKD